MQKNNIIKRGFGIGALKIFGITWWMSISKFKNPSTLFYRSLGSEKSHDLNKLKSFHSVCHQFLTNSRSFEESFQVPFKRSIRSRRPGGLRSIRSLRPGGLRSIRSLRPRGLRSIRSLRPRGFNHCVVYCILSPPPPLCSPLFAESHIWDQFLLLVMDQSITPHPPFNIFLTLFYYFTFLF